MIGLATSAAPPDRSEIALVIAAVVLGAIVLSLALIHAQKLVLVKQAGSYLPPRPDENQPPPPERFVSVNDVIPASDEEAARNAGLSPQTKQLRLLRGLFVGTDNRLSTSKTVAGAWTFAISYGLLALLIARWAGDPTGWNVLTGHGLQEEYLLLLGGPYAAAVIAKYQATNDQTKTTATPGTASAKDLIANDGGNADLGDFQYVLFNLLALAWYLGELFPHLRSGMPNLPSLLTGLALTSAGGYSAKKLVGQETPTLTSAYPSDVARNADDTIPSIGIWGTNLFVPSADGSSELKPTVAVANQAAVIEGVEHTVGADHLIITPPAAVSNDRPLLITVLRADGVTASGPTGAGGLTLTVRPHG